MSPLQSSLMPDETSGLARLGQPEAAPSWAQSREAILRALNSLEARDGDDLTLPLKAYLTPGDMLVAISSSVTSKSILQAASLARRAGTSGGGSERHAA